ncbi:hypothetical protein DXT99_04130 [Pontibacter diazotrophicus]|uniref:Uncharacterized protein n=1 Tax=Pontibacter diazotrophicus TaxID=1400979 RepID=A0A3D8LG77_9BACT|nr:hypothetical protein DXT99_04130 [Pontibacter diazotrophicus]
MLHELIFTVVAFLSSMVYRSKELQKGFKKIKMILYYCGTCADKAALIVSVRNLSKLIPSPFLVRVFSGVRCGKKNLTMN